MTSRRRALELFRLDAARWVVPEKITDAADLTTLAMVKLLVRYPPLRAMAWFRLGHAAKENGIRGIPTWAQRRIMRLYGLQLAIGDSIGGGLYVAHPVGCVLFGDSIGSNVTVISLVTFGMRDDKRWPRIGDEAFFGAGAKVLGGISIGEGAKVGANAVVLNDVAPGDTVVGIPARPVRSQR